MARILAFQSNPYGTSPLRLQKEIREIEQSFEWSGIHVIEIKVIGAVRVQDLQSNLLRYKPDIVHFSGHGNEYGEIYFESNNGNIVPMTAEALSLIFSDTADNLRCVILNSCFSEYQARAIQKHVPCVIGMSAAIRDDAAIVFSSMLYKSLAMDLSVEAAFKKARNEISIHFEDITAPAILFHKQGVNPNQEFVCFSPQIVAEFIMNRNKPEYSDEGNYSFNIYLKDYPANIRKVLYQFEIPDAEPADQFDEIDSQKKHFATVLRVCGEISIKAVLWLTDGKGVGISTGLTDALRNKYKNETDKAILNAIEDISEN